MQILFVLSDIQPSPSGNRSRPVKAVTFSPASWKLQAARLQVWRHKENWTMMDNGHSVRWMHLHKQTDQLVIDYIVYKRYKSHLDLAIPVLLFDRRFWDHVIIPMIAMSAILRPPNPQFATSEWFKRWISFKWFDKTETWKLRSIWSALGSSSALVPWTWTCQTERNSSTARQLDSSTHLVAKACPACPKALAQFRTWIQNQGNLTNGSHCF